LLHDIGKSFTKGYKDSKGNPCEYAHYYQHHLVSAYDAVRYLRFVEENDRLEILALIQWHMFPYFWEKDNNTKMQSKYKKLWGDELYDKIMLLHKADMEAH
jgi:CRISPR/Cas system-associated endonuclease Cas3-HD